MRPDDEADDDDDVEDIMQRRFNGKCSLVLQVLLAELVEKQIYVNLA